MINILNKKHDLANYFNLQYIGRGSILGNRWSHIPEGTKAEFVVATRDEAIDSFEKWIRSIINSDKEVTKELIRLYEIYDTVARTYSKIALHSNLNPKKILLSTALYSHIWKKQKSDVLK